MTKDPETAHPALVQPFPEPGPLLRLAHRELNLAANGTPEQVRALGDIRLLPRPWDPATCRNADLRWELWTWLDAVVTWLNAEYVWDVDVVIPSCWPRHPHLVHEIAVLADQRRRAGAALSSDPLEEWQRYCLPSFLERMTSRVKSHCEEGHQPWPAKGRHTRHMNQASRHTRADTYGADVRALSQGLADRAASAARLSVVDPRTDVIKEE